MTTTREQRLREFEKAIRELGYVRIADRLDAILAEPVEVSEGFLGALTRIYAVGYLSGHEDTVEGRYTDVVYSDRTTYHRDVVNELLHDSDYAALNIKEPGQ